MDGIVDVVDFSGRSLGPAFGLQEVVPSCIPIAHDGFGNFWVVDVARGDGDSSPVYFACHDAPVLLVQSDTLADFCGELVRMVEPPHASLIDDVHEDRLFDVWRKNPGSIPHAEALVSPDEAIRAFAASLDERFVLVDLRGARSGWASRGVATAGGPRCDVTGTSGSSPSGVPSGRGFSAGCSARLPSRVLRPAGNEHGLERVLVLRVAGDEPGLETRALEQMEPGVLREHALDVMVVDDLRLLTRLAQDHREVDLVGRVPGVLVGHPLEVAQRPSVLAVVTAVRRA